MRVVARRGGSASRRGRGLPGETGGNRRGGPRPHKPVSSAVNRENSSRSITCRSPCAGSREERERVPGKRDQRRVADGEDVFRREFAEQLDRADIAREDHEEQLAPRSRAPLRIAGCARIVVPISDNSTNRMRRAGRAGRRRTHSHCAPAASRSRTAERRPAGRSGASCRPSCLRARFHEARCSCGRPTTEAAARAPQHERRRL